MIYRENLRKKSQFRTKSRKVLLLLLTAGGTVKSKSLQLSLWFSLSNPSILSPGQFDYYRYCVNQYNSVRKYDRQIDTVGNLTLMLMTRAKAYRLRASFLILFHGFKPSWQGRRKNLYLFGLLQKKGFILETVNLLCGSGEYLALGEASLEEITAGDPSQLVQQGRLLLLPVRYRFYALEPNNSASWIPVFAE